MTDQTHKPTKRSKVAEETVSSAILQIKIDQIKPNRAQPRADFDNNSIIRLADSIRRYGILQPLTLRRPANDNPHLYELIAGERRLRAAKLLGYLTVPCVIVEVDEKMSAEMAIIENLLREDLNMFEQAHGFKQLIENYELTQADVARKMSLSQSAVANKLRLLQLSYEEQRLILETGLSERHARALLKIEDKETRIETIKHIAARQLNVANTEQYIEKLILSTKKQENISKTPQPLPHDSIFDAISLFEEKVDMLKSSGKEASIRVIEGDNEIDVRIRIPKLNSCG